MRTAAGYEVDFLATNPEGKRTYIQVCADLSTAEVRQRELRPLAELQSSRTKASFLLLTLVAGDVSVCQKEAPPGVEVRPAWEWLLEREG